MPVTSDHAGVALPTRSDPLLRPSSEFLGGPAGDRVFVGSGFWSPLRVVVALGILGYILAYLTKLPCLANGWADPGRYTHLCYSDMGPLYSLRGLADGAIPYISIPTHGWQYLEYPVLTGVFMWVASLSFGGGNGHALMFFNVNAIMLAGCFVVAIAATSLTVRRRPWDGAMVALAPAGLLAATINWDLLAVSLLCVCLALWSRKHVALAGIFLGLAAAAKFYPFLILLPIFVLCVRTAKLRQFGLLLGSTLLTWLAVNVPFMLLNFAGWSTFYTFSASRGQDFGSLWLVLDNLGLAMPIELLNLLATGLFLVGALAVAAIALLAKRRPRLAQLSFLVVAAFLVTNKVYSPQYVLWLIPLAVLARPRWRDFLLWQAAELGYYVAIWLYLAGLNGGKGIPQGWYSVAVIIQICATCWFAGLVVRDIRKPEHDPVRNDPLPQDDDDPGGGIFDNAPDATWLPRRTGTAPLSTSVSAPT